MAVRLAILDHSYREAWDWRDGDLGPATERLELWRSAPAGQGGPVLEQVRTALDDDLDFPRALAAVDDAASKGEPVGAAAALLGVELR